MGEGGEEGGNKITGMCVCSFNHSTWVQGVQPHLGKVQFSHAQQVVSDEGTVPVIYHKCQRHLDMYTVHMWQSRVEVEGYSVAYFDRIAAFEALYR